MENKDNYYLKQDNQLIKELIESGCLNQEGLDIIKKFLDKRESELKQEIENASKIKMS
jgi:hypothetical protein